MAGSSTAARSRNFDRSQPRTGPVGRLARLVLAVLLGWQAYDVWADRSFIVKDLDPGVLVLTGFAVFAVHQFAGLAGLGRQALVLIAAMLTGSAVLAAVLEHTVWSAPLSWFVWGLDLAALTAVAATALAAAVLGTPGCEIGVFRDVARRLRREPGGADALFCLVGLHRLDTWEARQRWHQAVERGERDHA
jgi:hypothetical protein